MTDNYFSHTPPADESSFFRESSINDSLSEDYVTAEEDNTQYLSILDSTTDLDHLSNMNITLISPKLESETEEGLLDGTVVGEDEADVANNEEQQVVIFSVPGSDELFGMQVVQDEEGVFHKYQFQLRKNDEGQLEAVPETIEILPMDDEEQVDELQVDEAQFERQGDEVNEETVVSGRNEDEQVVDFYEEESPSEESQNAFCEPPDQTTFVNIKQETIQCEEATDDQIQQQGVVNESAIYDEPPQQHYHAEEEGNKEDTYQSDVDQQHLDSVPMMMEEENHSANEDSCGSAATVTENAADFEHVVVNPEEVPGVQEGEEEEQPLPEDEEEEDDEIEEDEYRVINGLHVTGDIDADTVGHHFLDFDADAHHDDVAHSKIPVGGVAEKQNVNILRHVLKPQKIAEAPVKAKQNNYYVVVPTAATNAAASIIGKENFSTAAVNPRSILKTSYQNLKAAVQQEQHQQNRVKYLLPHPDCNRNNRYGRCDKEATQARLFSNFINKTTVPQAPVRSHRLPRKQKISPVMRTDEEIIVKEVMVSSNGFVENDESTCRSRTVKPAFKITGTIELTSSDDSSAATTDNNNRKRSRQSKKRKSDRAEVIDLDGSSGDSHDDDADGSEQTPPQPRRPRGRPKKISLIPVAAEKKPNSAESEPTGADDAEIPCPKCDKSFASQNSLRTHLQHHNLNSMMLMSNRHRCDRCQESFKNAILLSRHRCSARQVRCPLCKKMVAPTEMAAHKRLHVKDKLVRSTTLPMSPGKIKMATAPSARRGNAAITDCPVCGKVTSSRALLEIHLKTHRNLLKCQSCRSVFASTVLLENHIRESCVILKDKNASSANNKCANCKTDFSTERALSRHMLLVHKTKTPPRCSTRRQKLVPTREAHGGIPYRKGLGLVLKSVIKKVEGGD